MMIRYALSRLGDALDSATVVRASRLVGMVALLVSVWLVVVQFRQNECLADYAEASATSQRARAAAAEQDRRAQDEVFRSVAANPRAAIETLRAYDAARRATDALRAANPVPEPPSTACPRA